MAQKASKKRDPTIDEEKDVFLSFINKRIRNNRKKLEQIDDLSKREKDSLKAEQLEKINSKAEVLENFKYFEKIKDLYFESIKFAKDEGRFEGTLSLKKEETQGETNRVTSEPLEEKSTVSSDSLLKILNLVHFAQLFADQHKRDEFRSAHQKTEIPDFETFKEFYTKVFTFSEADKFERVESKIKTSLHELELYLNSTDKPALRNKSYKYLHETVERIANTSSFKDQKADISTSKVGASSHFSAIGSELRHEKSQQAPENEPRGLADLRTESNVISKKEEPKEHISPIKHVERETKPEPLTVQEVERNMEAQRREAAQGKQDWAELQDEEEDEEYGGEEEEEKQEVPQKKGDGFIEVKSKGKDNKKEAEGQGQRGGRGGRRGGRGGRGGPFRGGRGGQGGQYRGGQGGDRPNREGGEGQGQRSGYQGERGGYQGERGGYQGERGGNQGERGGNQGERGGRYFKKSYVEKQDEKKPEDHRQSHE